MSASPYTAKRHWLMASRFSKAYDSTNLVIQKGIAMLITILLVVLLLSLVGSIPAWPHSRGWGYGPSGGIGLVLLVLVVLMLMGRI